MGTSTINKLSYVGHLSDRTYSAIKNAIIDGILQSGQSLVESELAKQLGVSKTPVREALVRLESDGLVAREPNKGSYVRGLSVEELSEIYVVKRELEALAVRLATPKLKNEDIVRARKIIENEKDLWRHASVSCEELEKSVSFHDWLIDMSGNLTLASSLHQLNIQALRTRITLAHISGWLDTSAVDHGSILEHMAQGRSSDAEKLILLHNDHIIDTLKKNLLIKDKQVSLT